MKKIFALVLPLLLFSNTGFSYEDTNTDLTDLDQNYPYFANVTTLYDLGVIEGYDDGTFRPNNTINRAEFLKIIMEYSSIGTGGSNCFKDVKEEWFAEYVCSAHEMEIVDGYEDGTFRPQDDVSLVEASKILSVIFKIPLNEDDNETWYQKYVKALENKKAIPFSVTGFGHKVTRGEMAEIAVNARSGSGTSYRGSLTYDGLMNINDLPQKENFAYRFEKIYGHELEASGVPDGVDSYTFKRVALGTSSCGFDADAYDKCKLDTSELYRDANKIYYYPPDEYDSELIILEEADANTFQVLESIDYEIAFDKNYVYLRNKENSSYQVVGNVKEGMDIVYENIFTDGKVVYYLDVSTGEFIEMDGVDGATFREYPSSLDGMFEDKNLLYIYKFPALVQLNLDKNSFEVLYPSYGNKSGYRKILKDKNGVYYAWTDIEDLKTFYGADPDTFEIRYVGEEIVANDKDSFFTVDSQGSFKKHDNIDVETYEEIITQGDGFESVIYYVKDKNKVYSATDLDPIVWADPDTFEVHGYEYGFFMDTLNFIYGKSGDNFWVFNYKEGAGEIMSDVDFDTFEIMSDVEFRVYEEESVDTETYSYEDPGVCDLIEATYEDDEYANQYFEVHEDGTCSIIQEYISEAGYSYFSSFIARDKGHVWKYDDDAGVLEELDNVDVESFEQIGEYPFFKDKDHVYIPQQVSLEAMNDADPATFELKVFRGEYYFADKDTVWKMDDTEDGYSEIDNVDPDTFFNRGSEEGKNYLVIAEDDFEDHPGSLVDLETNKVLYFSDWLTEGSNVSSLENDPYDLLKYELLQSEYDLWIEPGDPEISPILSQLAFIEAQYDEITETDVKSAEFYNNALFGSDEVLEGVTFLVKTSQGFVYKMRILEFYPSTDEIVLEYLLVE